LKFSLRLNNDHPVADYVTLATAAEAAGFDQFWVSDDLFLRSAPVILAAIACATERIEIGTCILNPYTINPAEIAMLAATLDELSNQRFNLGLSSGAADFLKWIGITPSKPRTAVIETIQAINRLLSGEPVPYDGHFLQWTNEAYLRFRPLRRVPIYLGAMSANMLRTIGQQADGGLPLLFPPESYESVISTIHEGAKMAGRDQNKLDIAACIWVSVSDDRAAAEDVLKEKIAYYGHAMSSLVLDRLGLTQADFTAIEQAAMVENDLEKAKSLVTEPMMRIGIAGTATDLIPRLEGLVAMGATHISFGPPLGSDLLEAVESIGREVIPYFQQY
jgi:5,10-methylenetetrahydromethanopterin reductase